MLSKLGVGNLAEMVFNVIKSFVLIRECAEILESMKQLGEAAQLYESSQYYDKVGLTKGLLPERWDPVLCHRILDPASEKRDPDPDCIRPSIKIYILFDIIFLLLKEPVLP